MNNDNKYTFWERFVWGPLDSLISFSLKKKKKRFVALVFIGFVFLSILPEYTILSGIIADKQILNILYLQVITIFFVNLLLPLRPALVILFIHETALLKLPQFAGNVNYSEIIAPAILLGAAHFLTYAFTRLKKLDLGKIKEHMELLKTSQSSIENLIDHDFFAVLIHDGGRVISANDNFRKMFGYELDEIENLDIAFLMKAKDQNRFLKKLFLYEDFSMELEGNTKFGDLIPLEIISRNYHTHGGGFLQYCFVRDISHIKSISLELQTQKDYLQKIIDAYPHTLYVLGVDGYTIQFANKKVKDRKRELFFDKINGEDSNEELKLLYEKNLDLVQRSLKPTVFEVDYIDDNGEEKTEELHIHPFINEKKEIIQFVLTSLNVTWRKKAEISLKKALHELENMQDAVDQHAIVAITDPKGAITYVNEKFLVVSKYSRDELIGQNHRLLKSGFHPQKFFQNIWATITDGKIWQGEIKNLAKDGSDYWVFSTIVPFLDVNGKPYQYVSIRTDITQQKKISEELKLAKEEAEAANKAKSYFLANMSHEIRTPLNAVLGLTELTMDTKLTSLQADYLNTIKSSGESLLELINEILDFSKIEAGKLRIENRQFQLRRTINTTMRLFFFEARKKGLYMALDIDPKMPDNFIGDDQRIKQILINLLGNAVKFTSLGHVILKIFCTKTDVDGEVELKFSVIDSGIGISKKNQALIFESFTQEDSSTTRQYGGTGLGTTISKQLAEQMGGSIGVLSPSNIDLDKNAGPGSEFWFTIRCTINAKEDKKVKDTILKLKLNAVIINNKKDDISQFMKYAENLGMNLKELTNNSDLQNLVDNKKQTLDFFMIVARSVAEIQEPLQIIKSDDDVFRKVKTAFLPINLNRDELVKNGINLTDINIPFDVSEEIFMTLVSSLFYDSSSKLNKKIGKNVEIKTDKVSDNSAIHILVAEDNEINQMLVETTLTKYGYKVTVTSDGLEALQKLEQESFDIVFMDIQMPRMNGIEAVTEIRKKISKNLPVIAVTANASTEDMDIAFAAGMDAFVAKPYKRETLISAIHEWVKPKG